MGPTLSVPRTARCCICRGERWVCEEHPGKPWEHDGCGGAGVPCICNPHSEVEWREVYGEIGLDDAKPSS